jgi:HlyD family secretion protein
MKFFKRPIFWILLLVIVVIVGGIAFALHKKGEVTYTVTMARVQDLKQIVSVTGNVEPVSSVDLAFQRSGQINSINVVVGDQVYAGETLATLASADLRATLAQAQANVQAAQAKLDELQAGSAPADIAVEQTKLANDQIALGVAQNAVSDAMTTVGTTIDDAVRNKADEFFSNQNSAQPVFNLPTGSSLQTTIQNERLAMDPILTYADNLSVSISSSAAMASASSTVLYSELDTAKTNLNALGTFINTLATAVNGLSASSNLPQATIDNDKAIALAGLNEINSEISAVTSAEQGLQTAQAAVDVENSVLAQVETPSRPQDIEAQAAAVAEAQASVENAQAELAQTILVSPIDGVVTAKNKDVGEIVSADSAVISVISGGSFDIEAYVAETDIGNVKVGDNADITLDAYPNVDFTAKVVTVDPGETITEGVPTYKVTLNFVSSDERIKSGMTANIDITTDEVAAALTVPTRSIIQRSDGTWYVRVFGNSTTGSMTGAGTNISRIASTTSTSNNTNPFVETTVVGKGQSVIDATVTTGIRDDSGDSQILSGLTEGETVIVSSSADVNSGS